MVQVICSNADTQNPKNNIFARIKRVRQMQCCIRILYGALVKNGKNFQNASKNNKTNEVLLSYKIFE